MARGGSGTETSQSCNFRVSRCSNSTPTQAGLTFKGDMGAENSLKKLKRRKKTDKRRAEEAEMGRSEIAQEGSSGGNEKAKEHNKKKKGLLYTAQSDSLIFGLQKKSKKLKSKKRKSDKVKRVGVEDIDTSGNEVGATTTDERKAESKLEENKLKKSRRKKSKNVVSVIDVKDFNKEVDAVEQQTAGRLKKTRKTKMKMKMKMKADFVENRVSPDNLHENRAEDTEDEVYLMSSGDEDYSKGMKKWITGYHQSRPGLRLLQEKIDDFIEAHEAEEEKARVEREAQAAEGGWTVVVHHKGRKKTKDAESGIAVGSVAQAAVLDKIAKKKREEVGIDIYRFQKREAHRNEIAMLQSKFEQDKKRIQQLRTARKFRPY